MGVYPVVSKIKGEKARTKTCSWDYTVCTYAGRPGSSEVPGTMQPLTRWDVSSIPANGIFLTEKLKNENKNAQRVEND